MPKKGKRKEMLEDHRSKCQRGAKLTSQAHKKKLTCGFYFTFQALPKRVIELSLLSQKTQMFLFCYFHSVEPRTQPSCKSVAPVHPPS